jgi:hypothetical protein
MSCGERPRWGFCENCERWQLSVGWGDPAACPECGAPPRLLESWSGGAARVTLVLDLPPGGDLPLLG